MFKKKENLKLSIYLVYTFFSLLLSLTVIKKSENCFESHFVRFKHVRYTYFGIYIHEIDAH